MNVAVSWGGVQHVAVSAQRWPLAPGQRHGSASKPSTVNGGGVGRGKAAAQWVGGGGQLGVSDDFCFFLVKTFSGHSPFSCCFSPTDSLFVSPLLHLCCLLFSSPLLRYLLLFHSPFPPPPPPHRPLLLLQVASGGPTSPT